MKLVIVIHSLSMGGAERVTVNLANYWAGQGWDIVIVTMANVDEDFYSLHPDIRRIALQLVFDSTGLFSAIKHNVERIKALRSMLKGEKPDIALGMMTTANCLLSIATVGIDVPVVGSERIYPPHMQVGRAWEWLRRNSYSRLVCVVAQTEKSAKWLREQTTAVNVRVIPNPVIYPLARFEPLVSPSELFGANSECHILLAVGRLSSQKGYKRLISAFSMLAPRFSDWCLVIVGEGRERPDLERQVIELGLEGRVFLPGGVGNIAEWYAAADLYVMTSHFEGFPNTLVEAMAHGLPAISVDCDTGPRDIIRHEVDGLLVPVESLDALANALTRLMANKNLRRKYGEHALEVREQFSIEKIAGMWEALFLSVIFSPSKHKKR